MTSLLNLTLSIQMLHVLVPLLVKYVAAVDYCDPSFCSQKPGTIHTMCLYKNEGPSFNCEEYYGQGMSGLKDDEKRIILALHNERRNQVALGKGVYQTNIYQPSASNMRQMSWDDELEMFAQRWADQCVKFDAKEPHDKCRASARFNTGQNMALAGTHNKKKGKLIFPVSNITGLIMEWFKEIQYYSPEWVDGYRRHPRRIKTGHYSQFVWGETYLIGCGYAVYKETIRKKEYIFEKLVCNYGPSGNYLGSPLYNQGPPCSNCPESTLCNVKYGGLCAMLPQTAHAYSRVVVTLMTLQTALLYSVSTA